MARKKIEKNISYDDIKKLYYVNFDYGKGEDGKRDKIAKTFKKISDARTALKEFEANKTKGTLVIPKKTTLKEWLDYWMQNIVIPSSEDTTVYGYKNIINKHIVPDIGNTPIQQLAARQIQQYYTMLLNEKGLSPATVRKHHDLLKTALKVAVKQDALFKNPIDKVEPPKPEAKEANYYTTDEIKKLFSLVEGDRLEIVVKLAGYLGLRREEICGLSWENVDFDNRIISIKDARTMAGSRIIEKDPKNKTSIRKLYFADDLYEVLQSEQIRQNESKVYLGSEYIDSGLVVVWLNGKPYRPNYISELFTNFIEANNLPKITLHGLRHSFASVANSENISLFDISKALGHSTPTITGKLYTHLMDKT